LQRPLSLPVIVNVALNALRSRAARMSPNRSDFCALEYFVERDIDVQKSDGLSKESANVVGQLAVRTSSSEAGATIS
jgi:hypothetical protein